MKFFEITYVSLDPIGQRCADENIHVRNTLDETPVKDKERGMGDGRALRLRYSSDTCEGRGGTKDWIA